MPDGRPRQTHRHQEQADIDHDDPVADPTDQVAAHRANLRRRLVRSLFSMVAIGLGIHFLLPQLSGLESTGESIARANWWLPVILIALEVASLAAYGALLILLFRASGQEVHTGFVQRSTLVGNAVGRALPGGSGMAFAIMVGSFHGRGYDPVRTGSALWGAGVLSSSVLGMLLPFGVVIGLLGGHAGRIGVSAAVAAIGVVCMAALVPVAMRHPDHLADRIRRILGHVRPASVRDRIDIDAIADGARTGAVNLRDLATDRSVLVRATGLAVANWLLDFAVVVVLALTVGTGTPVSALLLAYVVAQVAAAIPLTPGGVGIVETAMIGALVASGSPAAAATATVLGWRLISHWLPIPFGLVMLPTLGARTARPQGAST